MLGRSATSPQWILRHAEMNLCGVMPEVEFRLSQSPHLRYEDAKRQAQEYSEGLARRLIWC